MTDTMKIRLINAYNELLKTVAVNGESLKKNLTVNSSGYFIHYDGYDKLNNAIDHLSEEIAKFDLGGKNEKNN